MSESSPNSISFLHMFPKKLDRGGLVESSKSNVFGGILDFFKLDKTPQSER